jgi:PRTRC genetic system protein E
MFQSLYPLLLERGIHIILSNAKDGKVNVYVEPVKANEREDDAFTTPFHCAATPGELDAELPNVLTQWIAARSSITVSLAESLAAAEAEAKAAAEQARQKAAERTKKVAPAAAKAATVAPNPSLLDETRPSHAATVADPAPAVAPGNASIAKATPVAASAISTTAISAVAVVTNAPDTVELF